MTDDMTDETTVDPSSRLPAGVLECLDSLGRRVETSDRLLGGTIASTWKLVLDDGSTVVLKRGRHLEADAWEIEADGLDGLRVEGGPEVPKVFGFGEDFLLIDFCAGTVPDDGPFWEVFGRRLATMHGVTNDRYGWHRENLLAAVRQRNPWSDDGWQFFGEHRLLRYLELENVQAALDADDRAAFEKVAGRLREFVPEQPPSLVHGDLWRPNVLAAGPERPALCDPAASYMWAEVDVSMLYCSGGVPDAFFGAYNEVRPLEGDWRARMPLLHLREQLSVLAHIGYDEGTVNDIRGTLARFS